MTTIVAVKKNGYVVIAADTQISFSSVRLTSKYHAPSSKIFKIKSNYIALSGYCAHDLVLQTTLQTAKKLDLSSRENIFHTFRHLHPILKEQFYLKPDNDDEDNPYESSQMSMLIINKKGIFGLFPLREVYEYSRFWAIGSGCEYALGAMFASYENEHLSAKEIARIGVSAGCEFDTGSCSPIDIHQLKL